MNGCSEDSPIWMIAFTVAVGAIVLLLVILYDITRGESKKLKDRDLSVVAFHAYLTHEVTNLPEKSTLVFDNVAVNNGNGYDPITGVFTCPCGGTYVFDWTLVNKLSTHFHSEMVVNGNQVALNYLNSGAHAQHQATTMTIVQLSKGDKVWIKPYTGHIGCHSYGSRWSKFSGFRL